MKKLFSVISLVAAISLSASAANSVQRTEQFSSIGGISVPGDFKVLLQHGATPKVELNVDARVADYCRAYIQGSNVVIELDTKNYPKELKNQLRQKNSEPLILEATVSIPADGQFNSISLKSNASLVSTSTLRFQQKLSIDTEDNSVLKLMNVSATSIKVKAENKSNVEFTATASNINVSAENNAVLNLKLSGKNAEIESSGSSTLTVDARVDNITVKPAGQSKYNLTGSSSTMIIFGKGNSYVDAHSFSSQDADVDMNSSECFVNPSKTLKIKLESGAKLVYDGSPAIEINKIQKSSVIRAVDYRDKNKH